ncbi:hypothetical protein [Membranihabitans maritimus]|uniref:hypothetical protein n=1 Tax=Membranihabitans maritimus TaxID=2904244 RepID=UPI001F3FF540|nr:hypothetical protein [Membranihabitans maritimus]
MKLNLIREIEHPILKGSNLDYDANSILGTNSWKENSKVVIFELYLTGYLHSNDVKNDFRIQEYGQLTIQNAALSNEVVQSKFDIGPILNWGTWNHFLASILGTPDYLFCSIRDDIPAGFRSVIYGLKNKKFYVVEDTAGYKRIIDDINGFFSFWPEKYLSQQHELLAYSYSADKIIKEYKESTAIIDDPPKVNSATLALMEKASKMGNPIIQIVKLKSSIQE